MKKYKCKINNCGMYREQNRCCLFCKFKFICGESCGLVNDEEKTYNIRDCENFEEVEE